MKNYPQKISSFIMSVVLVCALVPFQAAASYEIPGSCYASTDGHQRRRYGKKL